MDFKQFRYFVAVADELHMGRAAEKIGVAQPALSQQIKLLEHALKTPLFHREKRGIRLTDAGAEFLLYARVALRNADIAVDRGRRAGVGECGRLKVGYAESATYSPIWQRILADFRSSNKDVDVTLVPGFANQMVRELEQGIIDVATMRGPIPGLSAELSAELLISEGLCVALPDTHRLAHSEAIAIEDLANEDISLMTDDSGAGLPGLTRSLFITAGVPASFSPRALIPTTLAPLVACGFGIAIVPESFANLHVAGVVYRPLASETRANVFLVRRLKENRPVPVAFFESCRRSLESFGRGETRGQTVANASNQATCRSHHSNCQTL